MFCADEHSLLSGQPNKQCCYCILEKLDKEVRSLYCVQNKVANVKRDAAITGEKGLHDCRTCMFDDAAEAVRKLDFLVRKYHNIKLSVVNASGKMQDFRRDYGRLVAKYQETLTGVEEMVDMKRKSPQKKIVKIFNAGQQKKNRRNLFGKSKGTLRFKGKVRVKFIDFDAPRD